MSRFNQPDPRNDATYVHVGGELCPRSDAKISVLDSLAQGGDGVWEGLRLYNGKIFQLEEHLDRLFASAHAMMIQNVPARETIKAAISETLKANEMTDGVHIRLTLSRGTKGTSGMNPDLNTLGPTLIVLPEYKPPDYGSEGITLITSSIRRNPPQCIDSKIHHNNLINNILAKIEANEAGADDALMLDINGFVSETNATNIFLIKKGALHTPLAESCLPGLTRAKMLEIAGKNKITAMERHITLSECYTADEVFTTGTMGGLSPVIKIDGRIIGSGEMGALTDHFRSLYHECVERDGVPIN